MGYSIDCASRNSVLAPQALQAGILTDACSIGMHRYFEVPSASSWRLILASRSRLPAANSLISGYRPGLYRHGRGEVRWVDFADGKTPHLYPLHEVHHHARTGARHRGRAGGGRPTRDPHGQRPARGLVHVHSRIPIASSRPRLQVNSDPQRASRAHFAARAPLRACKPDDRFRC